MSMMAAGGWMADATGLGLAVLVVTFLAVAVARRRQFAPVFRLRRARREAEAGTADSVLRVDQLAELADQLAVAAGEMEARLSRSAAEHDARCAARERELAAMVRRADERIAELRSVVARAESLAALPPRPTAVSRAAPRAVRPRAAIAARAGGVDNAASADGRSLRERVWAELDGGAQPTAIAERLSVPLGEVEILKRLREFACPRTQTRPRTQPSLPEASSSND